MIAEARKRRIERIFELDGHVYAFDSTTIDLCLSVFEWAKFRKHKGGIKMHTLYDVEAEVPAFVHITPANIHDTKAMSVIPYERGAHYIFDRGYNDFGNLYTIDRIGAFFVVRAKTNVRIKPKTWKRRLPEGVISDVIGCFTVYKSSKDYPDELRKLIVEDPESGTRYIFLTNNLDASAELISRLYRNRWSVELFFKWIKQQSAPYLFLTSILFSPVSNTMPFHSSTFTESGFAVPYALPLIYNLAAPLLLNTCTSTVLRVLFTNRFPAIYTNLSS